MAENNDPNNTGTVIVSVVIMTCVAFAAVFGLAVAIPDGARASSMIAIVFAALGSSIGAVTILVRQDRVREVAKDSNQKLDRVLNGEMDEKLVRAVHAALDERKIANYSGDGGFRLGT